MVDLCKSQFDRRKLFMRHDEPYIFFQSQWQTEEGPSIFYLLYRWAVTMYVAGTWIYSLVDSLELYGATWLIYLTNWGYSFCLVQSLICSVCLSAWIIRNINKDNKRQRSSWLYYTYKIYWACNTIATDVAFVITVLYWILIYDQEEVRAQNVFVHGTNSIVMLIELCVLRHPIYFLHFYWSALLAIIYIVFSVIYYAAGGTTRTGEPYIYAVLDWRNAGTTVGICFAVLAFVILIHCLSTCISLLRALIHKRVFKRTQTLTNKGNNLEGIDNPAVF